MHPRVGLAGALLAAAVAPWLAWGVARAPGRLEAAQGFVTFALPLILVPAALWSLLSTRLTPGLALAGAAALYLALGIVYAVVAPERHVSSAAGTMLLWPTLLLWIDACRLGGWPCPAG